MVWSGCVSILQLAREAANGSQPSIPVEQDVLLHPPIYWNLSSNILDQSLDIDARFCISTSSNVPICIPKLEEDLILHLYLPLLHLLTKVSDWTINQMLRL